MAGGPAPGVLAAAVAMTLVATAVEVKLPTGRRVPPASGFASLSLTLAAGLPLAWYVCLAGILAAAFATSGAVRGRAGRGCSQGAVSALAGAATLAAHVSGGGAVTATFAAAGSVFLAGGTVLAYTDPEDDPRVTRGAAVRTSVAFETILLSIGALALLGAGSFGPAILPAMLVPSAIAWSEYRRLAAADETYRETVRALGLLAEAAGLASKGHHDRCARMCVAAGASLGVRGPSLRELELAALLHHVGGVAVEGSDDADVMVGRAAEAGMGLLKETEYLASAAYLLGPWRAEVEPLEKQVLLAACLADRSADPAGEAAARGIAPAVWDSVRSTGRSVAVRDG